MGLFGNTSIMAKEIIKFWGNGCMNCKALAPTVDALAAEYKDIKFRAINIHDDEEVAKKYEVTGLPTLVFVRDGAVVDRLVGLKPKSVIIKKIAESF